MYSPLLPLPLAFRTEPSAPQTESQTPLRGRFNLSIRMSQFVCIFSGLLRLVVQNLHTSSHRFRIPHGVFFTGAGAEGGAAVVLVGDWLTSFLPNRSKSFNSFDEMVK